jgi:hypothetical protein
MLGRIGTLLFLLLFELFREWESGSAASAYLFLVGASCKERRCGASDAGGTGADADGREPAGTREILRLELKRE